MSRPRGSARPDLDKKTSSRAREEQGGSKQRAPQGHHVLAGRHGDSTTIVVDDDHVIQVDLHDMAQADLDGAVVTPVVDELAACLPKRDGRPYLSVFALTHADRITVGASLTCSRP